MSLLREEYDFMRQPQDLVQFYRQQHNWTSAEALVLALLYPEYRDMLDTPMHDSLAHAVRLSSSTDEEPDLHKHSGSQDDALHRHSDSQEDDVHKHIDSHGDDDTTRPLWNAQRHHRAQKGCSRHRYVKCVAPMVRYSKLPFRLLTRRWGADLCYVPMVVCEGFNISQTARDGDFSSTGWMQLSEEVHSRILPPTVIPSRLVRQTAKHSAFDASKQSNPTQNLPKYLHSPTSSYSLFSLRGSASGGVQFCPDRPLGVQFGTKSPSHLLRSALAVVGYCDTIDINCGCPQRWAMKDGIGAALSLPRHLHVLRDMLRTLQRNNVRLPVSVKIRVLQDGQAWRSSRAGNSNMSTQTLRETTQLIRQVEQCGVSFVTVHGRTPYNKRGGNSSLNAIREVANIVGMRRSRRPPHLHGGQKVSPDRDTEPEECKREATPQGCCNDGHSSCIGGDGNIACGEGECTASLTSGEGKSQLSHDSMTTRLSHHTANRPQLPPLLGTGSMPLLANGDIFSLPQADFAVDYCGVQGVMSARAAMANPALFWCDGGCWRVGSYGHTPAHPAMRWFTKVWGAVRRDRWGERGNDDDQKLSASVKGHRTGVSKSSVDKDLVESRALTSDSASASMQSTLKQSSDLVKPLDRSESKESVCEKDCNSENGQVLAPISAQLAREYLYLSRVWDPKSVQSLGWMIHGPHTIFTLNHAVSAAQRRRMGELRRFDIMWDAVCNYLL